jgi:uncharacterized delta-60 repeat protein
MLPSVELASHSTAMVRLTSRRRGSHLMSVVACGVAFIMCGASTVSAQSVDTFNPGANGTVYTAAMQPDGQIVVAGSFFSLGGGTGTLARPSIGRIDATGSVDPSFNPGTNSKVFAVAVQPDGKILIGGDFTTLGCCGPGFPPRSGIARVSATGAWDLTFDPGANGSITAIAVQPDGKILVAGNFTMLGGGGTGTTPRNYLGRLNADGTLDASFDPGANDTVNVLALQPDGKILVGGFFTTLGGGGTGTTLRFRIGRLTASGSLDTSFNSGASNDVASMVVQPDGKILVGGQFTELAGGPRSHIGRLNADGTLDLSFDPGANNSVASLAIQTDGKIIAGGLFTMLGGGGTGTTPRSRIGRLNADGSLDSSFDPGANDTVMAVALQPDGELVAGGAFTGLGGGTGTTPRNYLGRITNTDAAVQSLIVTGTGSVLTWTRTGAAPEVSRTTFESSSDGATYTLLGSGTRVTNGWQLTGQSLPLNQNLFVRARGHYPTGYLSASGSIVESIVNTFIAAPPTVITGVVNGIGATTATLNGTANPLGLATTGSFEYGLTTSYGSTTAGQALGAGQIAIAIGGGSVAGLTCNTLYHFRAKATNASGTSNGLDATFTTSPCPPIVATSAATSTTTTSATLNGTVNPNGFTTTAQFEYGPTSAYGTQVTALPAPGSGSSPVGVSAAISSLSCNSTYHFRLTATNGTSANGSDLTFTTSACPPPTVVTSAGTGITTSGATLNGTVNPNGSSTTARFDYGLTTSYGLQATHRPHPGRASHLWP